MAVSSVLIHYMDSFVHKQFYSKRSRVPGQERKTERKKKFVLCCTSVTNKYSSVVCERVEADTSSQDSADCD